MRGGRRFLCIAMLLALVASPAHAETRSFVAWDTSKDALFMEFAIHPQAAYADGKTFMVVQGMDLDPHALSYDHATGLWSGPIRISDNPLVTDTHGAPALATDADGYLHVFFGCHSSELVHARSARPYDIDEWVDMIPVASEATYPQAMTFSDGAMEVFFRDSDQSKGWASCRSTDGGRTWTAPTLVLGAESAMTWYANFQQDGDDVLATFVTMDWDAYLDWEGYGRFDVHYMARDSSGVWESAAGDPVSVPVRPSDPDGPTLVYDSGADFANEVLVRRDAAGDPIILFLTGYGGGTDTYRWAVARWTGAAWAIEEITTTDHCYDTGTLICRPDGSLDAYLVTGGSTGDGGGDRTYDDRGGAVEHWRWAGASWESQGVISPLEAGTLFNHPQAVVAGHTDAQIVFMEWANGPSISAMRTYVYGDSGLLEREVPLQRTRVFGRDRVRTCIEASKRAYPAGAQTVVLATAEDFPDALAGVPLAGALEGSLLLVPEAGLTEELVSEIARLDPRSAVILGGPAAVGEAVMSRVKYLTRGRSVERIGGSDRYETAALVARRLNDEVGGVDRVYIASGVDFADALSASPVASLGEAPILLARDSWCPPSTFDAFVALGRPEAVIVGGVRAVGPAVERRLGAATRLAGADRHGTSAAVAEYGLGHGLMPLRTIIARSDRFPDALSAGVLATRLRSRLLLTSASALPGPTAAALGSCSTDTMEIIAVGGELAVPEEVLDRACLAAWGTP